MTNDSGGTGGSSNPYQAQTSANTGTGWLGDQTPVDVDLEGLGEYAKGMVTIQQNLIKHSDRLNYLGTLPNQAWVGRVIGEGAHTRDLMGSNYAELQQYIAHLATALNNIGMAAQTVADIYASTDGTSAASLNAVKWAFGDQSVGRPANLPPWVDGKTYWDGYFEALQNGTAPAAADSSSWTNEGRRQDGPNSVTELSTGPGGQRMEITTVTIPGGGTVVSTTIFAADGKVLSASSQRSTMQVTGNSVTSTTTSYDARGKVTGSSEETVVYGEGGVTVSESDVERNAAGDKTGATVTETVDGVQTTTKTNGENEVVQTVTVGPQTEGAPVTVDSPAAAAQRDIRNHDFGI